MTHLANYRILTNPKIQSVSALFTETFNTPTCLWDYMEYTSRFCTVRYSMLLHVVLYILLEIAMNFMWRRFTRCGGDFYCNVLALLGHRTCWFVYCTYSTSFVYSTGHVRPVHAAQCNITILYQGLLTVYSTLSETRRLHCHYSST